MGGMIQSLASSSKIIRQPFESVAGANIEVQKSEEFKKDNEFGSILHAEVKDIKEFEKSTEISSLSKTQATAAIRRAKNTIRRRKARIEEKHYGERVFRLFTESVCTASLQNYYEICTCTKANLIANISLASDELEPLKVNKVKNLMS